MDELRRIARAVLYEGYLLWPYRQSALKNQHRWTIGGVHPEPYGRAHDGNPWLTQTQCLIEAGPADTVDVRVRFLHLVASEVARCTADGLDPVPELTVGERRFRPREEAVEQEVAACGLRLGALLGEAHRTPIGVPAGRETEWLTDEAGRRAGAVLRSRQALRGHVDAHAEELEPGVLRLTVRVVNTTPWHGDARAEAMRHTFVAAHSVLHTTGGRFVSLMDPPEELRAAAAGCRNVGTWPVLAGPEGEGHTMLSAPIILYDHPRVAPESPGDLFDATEIDQLLTLSVLALSDEEKREIRDGDPRGREILERCQALTPEQLMRLHGIVRTDPAIRTDPAVRAEPVRAEPGTCPEPTT
ncbi:hypothetical protein ACWGH8_26950 [Nonomuraea muscovyensis]|uniref:Hydrogenase maturation protease n=1 Tax=Nonomuraea muscovyensis TaxID=1124761 RepID=A0A7X0F189_9ACTN|nr:hypothetical protein [Nonomuraea muscovyensis]MBB6348635.1 hypothetical protein [Nonomuraea muscovyensis]